MKQIIFSPTMFLFKEHLMIPYKVNMSKKQILLTTNSYIDLSYTIPREYRLDKVKYYDIPNYIMNYTCFVNQINNNEYEEISTIPYFYQRITTERREYALHPKSVVKCIQEIVNQHEKWTFEIPDNYHETDPMIKQEISRILDIFLSRKSNSGL